MRMKPAATMSATFFAMSRLDGANPGALRRDASARCIIQGWRQLTSPRGSRRAGPGAGTLIACSGGADSSALVLALAPSNRAAPIVVAHVLHDLRPRDQVLADLNAVQALALRVGAKFVQAEVRVRDSGGNLEAAARTARYAALLRLAKREKLRFIATAHHADDQLETILMALMRGAGPRGLGGIAISRPLEYLSIPAPSDDVCLIRPMIEAGVERADTERICQLAGWAWQADATNADQTRLRAAVRLQIVPLLKALRPTVAQRAVESARLLHFAAAMMRMRAETLWRQGRCTRGPAIWPRSALRRQPAVLLGELIRIASRELAADVRRDGLNARAIAPVVRAIRDDSTEPRHFTLSAINAELTAKSVTISARSIA